MIKTVVWLFMSFACLLLLIQIPVIGTSLLQSVLNVFIPEPYSASISRFYGSFPFEVHVQNVTISDKEGVWAELENASYIWRAIDILFGNFHIDQISIDRLRVHRLPDGAGEKSSFEQVKKEWGQMLNTLPHINIDNLHIREITLPTTWAVPSLTVLGEFSSGYFGHHSMTLFLNRHGSALEAKDMLTLVGKQDKESAVLTAYLDFPLEDFPLKAFLPNALKNATGSVWSKIKVIATPDLDKSYLSCRGEIKDLVTPHSQWGDFVNKFVGWKVKVQKDAQDLILSNSLYCRTGRGLATSGALGFSSLSGELAGQIQVDVPYSQQFFKTSVLSGEGLLIVDVKGSVYHDLILSLNASGFAVGGHPVQDFKTKIVMDPARFLTGTAYVTYAQEDFVSKAQAAWDASALPVLRFDPIHIKAPETTVKGAFAIDLSTHNITGQLSGYVSRLAPYAVFVGKPVEGKLEFDFQALGNQRASFKLFGQDIVFDTLKAQDLVAAGAVKEWWPDSLTLTLKNPANQGNILDKATLRLGGESKDGFFEGMIDAGEKQVAINGQLIREPSGGIQLLIHHLMGTHSNGSFFLSLQPLLPLPSQPISGN